MFNRVVFVGGGPRNLEVIADTVNSDGKIITEEGTEHWYIFDHQDEEGRGVYRYQPSLNRPAPEILTDLSTNKTIP